MTILTKNTDKLRQEVAAHVAADSIVQGNYWNKKAKRGRFIDCLAKGNNPAFNEATYGLPVILQCIAESIFEGLPPNQAKAFFAALPDAVACDGKDLTEVSWRFLAAELRSLPEQPAEIQAVIDPVIAGMDLFAGEQEWPAARAAADACAARAAAWAARAAIYAARAAVRATRAAICAARATRADADAAAWAAVADAAAAVAAAWAARAAARAADAAWATRAAAAAAAVCAAAAADAAAVRLRQRDLLLRLIAEAPVVESHQ